MSKIPAPNYTQAPNCLFDYWVPLLGEIELKVTLVIMRKTFGWHKERDRISISQLEKLTGSGARHILKAVQSLIDKGLIKKEVTGQNGKQQTYYELVIEEDLNNSYPCPKDTPVQKTPLSKRHPCPKDTPVQKTPLSKRHPCPKDRGDPFPLDSPTPVQKTGTKETITKEIIKQQQQPEKPAPSVAVVFSNPDFEKNKLILKNLGFDDETCNNLARVKTEIIEKQIEFFKKKDKTKMDNPLGWLRKAIENDWRIPETPEEKRAAILRQKDEVLLQAKKIKQDCQRLHEENKKVFPYGNHLCFSDLCMHLYIKGECTVLGFTDLSLKILKSCISQRLKELKI